jgi:hypothetical protein
MQSWFSSYISFNYGQNSKLIAGKLYYQIHATKPITHKTHQNYSNKTHHTQNPSKVIKQNPSKMEVSHHKMQQNNITKTWERKIERTKLRDSYLREKTKRTTERGRERLRERERTRASELRWRLVVTGERSRLRETERTAETRVSHFDF